LTTVRRLLFIVILLTILSASVAQGQQLAGPLIALVEGRELSTSSVTNIGAAGASRLQGIFRDLDARVVRITLDQEIPADVQLVVLLGPLRRLRTDQVARLWVHLRRGHNLLIAVDPDNANVGTTNVSHQVSNSGMTTLLDRDYGIIVQDTFLAAPYFTNASISNLDTTFLPVYPDTVPNDVIAPLVQYHLPVWTWGTRSMVVEPFGINGRATPLLYTDSAYGETDPDVFPPSRNNNGVIPDPLQFDAGEDIENNWLNTAALAENIVTGSRVAVLGDSEMLENGYGLLTNGNVPRFPGNYVLAQRLSAWLLNIAPQKWPSLPSDLTWIAVDGSGADWPANATTVVNQASGTASDTLSIRQVRAFSDDQFLYLLVETTQPPVSKPIVRLQYDTNNNGQIDQTISIQSDHIETIDVSGHLEQVPDALVAYGDAIEVRLPIRVVSPSQSINYVCLLINRQDTSCTIQPIVARFVSTLALTELSMPDELISIVRSDVRINLRRTPSTDQSPITTIANGTTFNALGRNDAGDWVYVQNARNAGWVVATNLLVNGNVMSLPVIDGE
jgi:hypothetical protein